MPRTADPTDIPRRLTEAGYALFQQAGYNATGIAQITELAGVPKGSFYNHFDSKEAFAAAILRHYADRVETAWSEALATVPHAPQQPATPLATIAHIFQSFASHHARAQCQGCLVGNFAGEMVRASPLCAQVIDDILSTWRQRLAALIALAQGAGQARTDLDALSLSTLFWDAWEGALLRAKIAGHAAPLQDTLTLMLDKMLAPQTVHRP
jgi:TetR/AcrR family transcriptional regulator, transcriptional repressor for nem operon